MPVLRTMKRLPRFCASFLIEVGFTMVTRNAMHITASVFIKADQRAFPKTTKAPRGVGALCAGQPVPAQRPHLPKGRLHNRTDQACLGQASFSRGKR